MLKATATGPDGRPLLVIGLSFRNLEHFRKGPGDSHIMIAGGELGLPIDVLIFSGETEAHLAQMLTLGPGTIVDISDKLKS